MKKKFQRLSVQPIFLLGCSLLFNEVGYCAQKSIVAPGTQIVDSATRLEYARVLSYEKRYDDAIAEYKKLLADNPNLLEAKIEMAKVYYYQGKYAPSEEILNQVPPENMTPDLNALLGDIYMSNKQYDKAEEKYRQVLLSKPDEDTIKFKLADMLSWQKKYEASLTFYRELIKKHPQDIQLRRKYAMVLNWSGKKAEAAEELKKTLK